MPIVPYFQTGGGQVPLRDFLPVSSPSPSIVDIPDYPSLAIHPPEDSSEVTQATSNAAHEYTLPTIDFPTRTSSHAPPPEEDISRIEDAQMKGKKPAVAAAGTFFSLFSFSQLYQNIIFPHITPPSERADESSWIASSHSWIDQKSCRWFGLCGVAHLNKGSWGSDSTVDKHTQDYKVNLTEFWHDAQAMPEDERQGEREVPKYVLDYAPLIHLYSGEEYWPCDMMDHLFHTTPHLNYTPLQAVDDHPNLSNLHELNRWGRFVYLQSDDNVEDRPDWLGGETNIPTVPKGDEDDAHWEGPPRESGLYEVDEDGQESDWFHVGSGDTKDRGGVRPVSTALPVPTRTPQGEELLHDDTNWQSELRSRRRRLMGKKVVGGRSDAPAVLIVVPKPDGVVDAFWFFFYSYNLGNAVFNVRFGNHVGDWEHTVVRFHNGEPKAVFFSEHSFGEAYTYEAIEKIGKRVSVITLRVHG